jgi:Lipase (class 3)
METLTMAINKTAAAYLSYFAYIDDALGVVLASDFSNFLTTIPSGPANGPWTLCWGPAVNDGVLAYVAKGADGSYALAFRGTDVDGSISGTLGNIDADVDALQVPFLYPQQPSVQPSSQRQISAGINGALALAIGLTDPATDLSLLDYLRGLAKAGPLDLMVTGHSLGGALTVVATAWLKDQLPKLEPLTFTLWPHTFAAPTMWNEAFAASFSTDFTYYAVVNTNDVVPMGWADLGAILETYQPPGPSLYDTDWWFYETINGLNAIVTGYASIAPTDTFTVQPTSNPSWTAEAGLMHSMQNIYFKYITGEAGPNLPGTTTTGFARPRRAVAK